MCVKENIYVHMCVFESCHKYKGSKIEMCNRYIALQLLVDFLAYISFFLGPTYTEPYTIVGLFCDNSHDSLICGTWLTHLRDMTHSYVQHDTLMWVTSLTHMCDMTRSFVWHDSLICVTWLTHFVTSGCKEQISNRCDTFIFVTWLTHMRDVTQSYVWHDALICVSMRCKNTFQMGVTRSAHEWINCSVAEHSSSNTHTHTHTHTVKCKYHASQKRKASHNEVRRYQNALTLFLNSRLGFSSLKYLYSVISVKLDLLPANTKYMVIDLFVDGLSAISRIVDGIFVTWLTHMCDVTHSYVWYDALICVTSGWWEQISNESDAFICVTWLIHMCDVTHSYVWHDAFICVTSGWWEEISNKCDAFIFVTWLTNICDVTHSYVWHDAFIFVTWLTHIWGVTHSYVWHDARIFVTWLAHTCDVTCDWL